MFAGLFCARARIIRSTCAIIQTIFHVITIQVIRIPARKYFHSVPLTVNQHFKSCVKNVSSKLQIICKYSKLGVCAGVCLSSRESRGPKDRSQWSSQSRAAVMCITVSYHTNTLVLFLEKISKICVPCTALDEATVPSDQRMSSVGFPGAWCCHWRTFVLKI